MALCLNWKLVSFLYSNLNPISFPCLNLTKAMQIFVDLLQIYFRGKKNVALHVLLDTNVIITSEFNKLSFLSQEFKYILNEPASKKSKKAKG